MAVLIRLSTSLSRLLSLDRFPSRDSSGAVETLFCRDWDFSISSVNCEAKALGDWGEGVEYALELRFRVWQNRQHRAARI